MVLWELLAISINKPIILPRVTDVFAIIFRPTQDLLGMGSLIDNLLTSLVRVMIGYFAAVLIAIPVGIIMGYNLKIYDLLSNFLGLFRPIPPLAWVPLVLAWFGVASMANFYPWESGTLYLYLRHIKLSMVFIIFIGAFFPILTSTIYGVANVKKILIESAHTLGAGDRDIFLKILIPAAAPSIVNGMRTGLGVAWMCLVSAEMLPGSVSGVGYLITHAYTLARTDVVICGMIVIGIFGAFLDYMFRQIENTKFKWQKNTS